MTLNSVDVSGQNIAECFASFFDGKVGNIVRETVINPMVYNGHRKMLADNAMFMTSDKILECIDGLKLKNTEGFDRIP